MNPGDENETPLLEPQDEILEVSPAPLTEPEQADATAPQAPASVEAAQGEGEIFTTTGISDAEFLRMFPDEAAIDMANPGAVVGAFADSVGDTWQERLLAEHNELLERLNKLGQFLKSPPADLHPTDAHLLYVQRRAMDQYLEVLNARLKRAGVSV